MLRRTFKEWSVYIFLYRIPRGPGADPDDEDDDYDDDDDDDDDDAEFARANTS